MDLNMKEGGITMIRKGLLLRGSLAVAAPQPPRRNTDILVLAENSPEGPMSTASKELGTRGSRMT